MKKFFISLAVFVMALCANAQTNQYFWYNGNLMMGNPIAQIDSVTFGEGEPADTLHILLPRTIIKEVHDTVYITIHDTVCPNDVPEGALNGLFSVSADKKVRFSKGNLQYQASTDTWRFAENQYDTLRIMRNTNTIPTHNGWQDLFAWGTGNNPTLNTIDNQLYSTFVDWGNNIIDGIPGNTFRTLSCEEWIYLFVNRTNAASLFGTCTIDGRAGVIVFPDNYDISSLSNFNSFYSLGETYNGQEYSTYTPGKNHFSDNTYSIEEWKIFENEGAVFLPACIYDDNTLEGMAGAYQSSTSLNSNWNRFLLITNGGLNPQGRYNKYDPRSVRLVQDVVE